MKAVLYDKIYKESKGWLTYYADNKKRGEDAVDFFLSDNQWDGDVASRRTLANKESLTFNVSVKHLRRQYTQLGEIEFSLDIMPLTSEVVEDVTENSAFRLLLHSIMLSDNAY